jgi:hypothetical protein
VIASPGSVEAQRAFILGDPKPEADVGNLAQTNNRCREQSA